MSLPVWLMAATRRPSDNQPGVRMQMFGGECAMVTANNMKGKFYRDGVLFALVHNLELITGGVDAIDYINIVDYEPACDIIGDMAKNDPKTRQSVDYSMAFIM